MKNNIIFSHVSLFTANLIYALTFTIAKSVMPEYVAPIPFILLRVTGAVLLFLLLNAFIKAPKIEKKDWWRIGLCGLLGVAMNQMLFFKGLNYTSPINAAVVMTSTPVIVFIGALLLKQEFLNWKRAFGILLGAGGAICIIALSKNTSLSSPKPGLGNLLVFINAMCYAGYLILAKPLMKKYNPLTIIKWSFIVGWVVVFPFGIGGIGDIEFSQLPSSIIWAILFVVVCTTFLAYLLNITALKNLRASTVSFYIYLQPLLASAFAIYQSSDILSDLKIYAGLAIFLGVYLVSSSPKPIKNT
ncbi:MAG: DMT family transporter [Flavobacteriales bacterium]